MSLLRIRASLLDPPQRCEWALVNDDRAMVVGEGLVMRQDCLPRYFGQQGMHRHVQGIRRHDR